MNLSRLARLAALGGLTLTLAACGGIGSLGSANPFGGRGGGGPQMTEQERIFMENTNASLSREERAELARTGVGLDQRRETIFDLFRGGGDGSVGVKVNRYLWTASLDVLNFLPVETVDPFTGVISTGYGTPPGGRQSYRATVYISDPALDARSLKVALQTRGGGAVSPELVRQVEDAILTRARQLRVRDAKF